MSLSHRRALLGAIVSLVAVLAAIALGVATDDGAPPPATTSSVVTLPLAPSAIADPGQPDAVTVPSQALEQAARATEDHRGSRSENPPGVSAGELDAGREQQEDLVQRDDLPNVTPLAAPSQRGCRSTFVRNASSRRGVKPRLFVVHYTVSANRPGWDDVNAIVGLFNTPSFAASSSYVIDDEAHCAYIVRESDKPWTQAGFNPVSISVEMIATGREGRLTSAAGMRRLGQVISDSTRRWGIPLQRGAVSGCTVTRAGIVDHRQLGSCGGGHVDISPYSLAPVIAAAKAARAGGTQPSARSVLTKAERTNVDELQKRRLIARRNGGWTKIAAFHNQRAEAAKAWLRARLKTIASGTTNHRPARRAYIAAVIG
ncbi:N-acetylmuramoyl-L-alanine amidase [Patulibacter brassicae]|uniref:N-acetylmuramoyl-L-alanine amidase n=1 Tax=Patulibacter brassicae TaxID=1705717 RepID=A0ABU4VJH8_9ACTN|nr:N-acetylmuramoyl-L-alanine amidase [Patulibacter brassicae]MDX8151081.1 N-acetylmuramoyl-L-alanine amidase [Patulibacter brassicae]